ncbi:MAG: hypothetical protein ACRC60_04470 [Plesiomonas shigelloides]
MHPEKRINKKTDRRQKTEDRRQKTEDRRQKTEDRRQKTEDRRQKTESLPHRLYQEKQAAHHWTACRLKTSRMLDGTSH